MRLVFWIGVMEDFKNNIVTEIETDVTPAVGQVWFFTVNNRMTSFVVNKVEIEVDEKSVRRILVNCTKR